MLGGGGVTWWIAEWMRVKTCVCHTGWDGLRVRIYLQRGTETHGAETPGAETPGGETPGAETTGAETHGVETIGSVWKRGAPACQ